MKKLLAVVTAAVALSVIMAGIAGSVVLAGGTNTLTVNATVSGSCQFITATSTLSFTLDPGSGANATATTVPTLWCTRGTTATITVGNGTNFTGGNKRMKSLANPNEFIPYSLVLTPVGAITGLGKNTPINLTITGTVLTADYVNALAANDYTDTVVITITP
jgi:spore coat protein U-like protein